MARFNRKEHGIGISDAEAALYEPVALSARDADIDGEERFLAVGCARLDRVLVVHCTHRGDSVKLISARATGKSERSEYEKGIRL